MISWYAVLKADLFILSAVIIVIFSNLGCPIGYQILLKASPDVHHVYVASKRRTIIPGYAEFTLQACARLRWAPVITESAFDEQSFGFHHAWR